MIELIETFNICPSHYFSAKENIYGDDDESDSEDDWAGYNCYLAEL